MRSYDDARRALGCHPIITQEIYESSAFHCNRKTNQRIITSLFSRERNKLHARKTRERKKQQLNALQCRLSVLETEVNHPLMTTSTDTSQEHKFILTHRQDTHHTQLIVRNPSSLTFDSTVFVPSQ